MGYGRTLALLALAAAITTAAITTASVAHAETYKWIDPQGRVQYTDRLPVESVNRGNVQLSRQGVAKTVTEAPLSAEQKQAIEARLAREREVDRIAKEKAQQENALLGSYTSEDDIEIARKRNLALIGAAILSAEARIKSLQRRIVAIEREKLFYENKPFPEKLKRELAAVQAEIPMQHSVIAQRNEDALVVNQRYDDLKQKFVDVKTKLAAQTAKR